MYYLIFISIALALYAFYVAQKAHQRLNYHPRSFHFTLIKREEDKNAKINFYIFYLSGTRVFLDQESEYINFTPKINISAEIMDNKLIECWSQGDSLIWRYVLTNKKKEYFEAGDELSLGLLSLPKSSHNREVIEKHLKQEGWEIKRALSTDDLYFVKENLEVCLTYIS